MRRAGIVIFALLLAALACNTPEMAPELTLAPQPTTATSQAQPTQADVPSARPAELSDEQIDRITRASVQIIAAQSQGGSLEPAWSGSGTIISPSGEIVTNCHVACGAPVLVISLTTNVDLPPQPTYIAEITHYDEAIDLAILQITTDMDGRPVSPTDLPYLDVGDSNSLTLGDPIRIFGYPGVGGETITYTSGSVSGFESATIEGASQRVIIKTDASIASGNSGGTAVDLYGMLVGIPTSVNPDVREGVTIGGIGVLRPVNLVNVVRGSAGAPPAAQGSGLPPAEEADPYEPNDDYSQATGPVPSGEVIEAYISWEQDIDVYYIQIGAVQTISATLTNIPSGTDYDLHLLDSANILASSDSQASEEFIEYVPSEPGTYWIAVSSYDGASSRSPYTLTINYGGGAVSGEGTITLTGKAVDGNTGDPLPGGQFGALAEGVTCDQFFGASNLDMSLVISYAETNTRGMFELLGIPRGANYAAYFIYGSSYVCENDWLEIPSDAVDSDLGVIEMSF